MASFVGTKKEFKRYVGPMLRNLVQQLTKKHKQAVGSCQHCGTTESLEAAHVHGKDRGSIIDKILDNYTNNDIVTIDLAGFEKHFRDEHRLIDETIIILCKTCHSQYDSIIKQSTIKSTAVNYQATNSNNGPAKENISTSKRIFTNKEIQERISRIAQSLDDNELEALCNKDTCKDIFGVNFPVFIKISINNTLASIREAVKDSQGMNRWTWKYKFERNNYLYAITTQWYDRNDIHVKHWFSKHEK